jgi:hypothetical protein
VTGTALLRRGLLALFALAVGACGEHPAETTLQVVGDTVKVRAEEPLPRQSAIFDGRVIRLRAARGEVLGLQVLLRDRGTQPVELRLESPGVTVEAFEVGYVPVRQPSTALYGKSRGPGHYPDLLSPTTQPVRTDDHAFFDLEVEADAPPGLRRGALWVGGTRIPVELTVDAVVIDRRASPVVWAWYHPGDVALAHGVPRDDGPIQLAWEERYVELFARHGVLLATDPSPPRLAARRHLLDDTARFWPVWIDKRDRAAMERQVRAWIEIFDELPQTPFTIPVDEPRTMADRLRVRANGEAIRKAGGGPGRFLHAVTDRPRLVYGDTVDVFISPMALPAPAGASSVPRRWTYNGRPPRAGSMIIDTDGVALRTWGWIAHRYDVEVWYAWQALYFLDRYNGAAQPTDLPRDPVTFDERRRGGESVGNGDGVLAYPGALPSLRLKALRRGQQDRLLLRALADCGGGFRADALTRVMIPRALGEAGPRAAWPDDETSWERARHALLDAIAAVCSDAPQR